MLVWPSTRSPPEVNRVYSGLRPIILKFHGYPFFTLFIILLTNQQINKEKMEYLILFHSFHILESCGAERWRGKTKTPTCRYFMSSGARVCVCACGCTSDSTPTVTVRSLAIFFALPFMVMGFAQTARLSGHSLSSFLHHCYAKEH